jgi:transposase
MYGDQDEIAFTWSNSKGFMHAKTQLDGFSGVLLTDGSVVVKLLVAY